MTFFAFYRHFLQVNNSSIDENAHYSVYQSQKMKAELFPSIKRKQDA